MGFIEFINQAEKNNTLVQELMSIMGNTTPLEECIKILENKDFFKNGKIIPMKAAY